VLLSAPAGATIESNITAMRHKIIRFLFILFAPFFLNLSTSIFDLLDIFNMDLASKSPKHKTNSKTFESPGQPI
jgi:hypothetical protein